MKPKKTAVKYSENATEERYAKLAKKKDALREIKMLINFEILADKIDELVPASHANSGRKTALSHRVNDPYFSLATTL